MFKQNAPIILASASPRRKAFLESLQVKFTCQPAAIDEGSLEEKHPKCLALRLAKEKATAIAVDNNESCVIGADTIVSINNTLLGKPKTAEEAFKMLQQLRGKTHTVTTGVAIIYNKANQISTFTEQTQVTFTHFSDTVLWRYIESGDPMDKSGSYGIQSNGAFLVESLQGSFTNVVGLPLSQTLHELMRLHILN